MWGAYAATVVVEHVYDTKVNMTGVVAVFLTRVIKSPCNPNAVLQTERKKGLKGHRESVHYTDTRHSVTDDALDISCSSVRLPRTGCSPGI